MSSLGQAAANTDLDANTYHHDYGNGLFRKRRHWKQREEDGGKMLEGDFGHFGYRDHFDIVPPLPPAHIFGRAAATNADRRFLTFFKGKGSNSVRRAVIDLHDPTRGVIMVDSSGKGKKEFSYDCAYTCVHFVRVQMRVCALLPPDLLRRTVPSRTAPSPPSPLSLFLSLSLSLPRA